jgi:hypothetical protein
MAAKVSAEMLKAKRLVVERGLTPYAAAKEAKISTSAIYMSQWYKDRRDANKKRK